MTQLPDESLQGVAGVDYGPMDWYKKAAREAADATTVNLPRYHGSREVPGSRGQSAYLIDTIIPIPAGVSAIAYRTGGTPEGIGTKPLVAQAWQDLTGEFLPWANIGRSSVAVMVNDAATQGIFVTLVEPHLAVADAEWFNDQSRALAFLDGYQRGVMISRAAMGAGETAALEGVIVPGAIEISGSVHGHVGYGGVSGQMEEGLSIVFFRSSGIHDNGLTKARGVAKKIEKGYLTELGDGRTYGEALLTPTCIYLPIIEDLLQDGVILNGVINISGHGLRKLMRYGGEFTYVIDKLYPVPQELELIADVEKMTPKQSYAAMNNGNGYAILVRSQYADAVCQAAAVHNIDAMVVGHVETGPRKVVLDPIGVEYDILWEE